MDGTAVMQTFATYSDPDCLKEVIPKFGVRVKVYLALKKYLQENEPKVVS